MISKDKKLTPWIKNRNGLSRVCSSKRVAPAYFPRANLEHACAGPYQPTEGVTEWAPPAEGLEAKAPPVPEADGKRAGGGITSKEILHALGRGEDGDAELFIKLNRGRFCFDHADRRWYEFAGHFWKLDRTEKALAAVSDVIDIYAAEASRQAELKHNATVEAHKERRRPSWGD